MVVISKPAPLVYKNSDLTCSKINSKNLNQALISYLTWGAKCFLGNLSFFPASTARQRTQWKILNVPPLKDTPSTQARLHSLCKSTVRCPLQARSPGCQPAF